MGIADCASCLASLLVSQCVVLLCRGHLVICCQQQDTLHTSCSTTGHCAHRLQDRHSRAGEHDWLCRLSCKPHHVQRVVYYQLATPAVPAPRYRLACSLGVWLSSLQVKLPHGAMKIHGVLMLLAFAVLLPAGLLTSRHSWLFVDNRQVRLRQGPAHSAVHTLSAISHAVLMSLSP